MMLNEVYWTVISVSASDDNRQNTFTVKKGTGGDIKVKTNTG